MAEPLPICDLNGACLPLREARISPPERCTRASTRDRIPCSASVRPQIRAMSDTLMQFPCDFPLKVMGRHSDDFRSLVVGIVQKHAGPVDPARIEERPSKDGNYLSVTCTFSAQSREQLDRLYMELTSCERVMIVL